MNDSFILYTSYYAIIEGLTDQQLGQLTRALFIYARDGEQIQLEPVVRMAFAFIKDNIDRNADKYREKCERNRENIRKRWNKKNTNEYDRIQSNKKNTNEYEEKNRIPYDNDNDNEDDNDVVSKDTNNMINKEDKSSMSNSVKPNVDPAEKSSDSQSSVKKSKTGASEYAAIKEYWNKRHDETNSAMRRMTLMSDNRKTMVRARLRQVGGDIKVLYQAIDNAMSSDFMNGTNGKNWVASFDWIFGSGGNFAKVLDGNYENATQHDAATAAQSPQPKQSLETGRQTVGERYKQAAQKHETATDQDNKYRAVIMTMLDDLAKNPRNQAAKNSLARFYENGVLQRLGIDWKPEK